jgi:hypothetical protein
MANNAALASGTSDINISCVSEVMQGVIAIIGLVSSMFSQPPQFLLHHDQVHQIEETVIIVALILKYPTHLEEERNKVDVQSQSRGRKSRIDTTDAFADATHFLYSSIDCLPCHVGPRTPSFLLISQIWLSIPSISLQRCTHCLLGSGRDLLVNSIKYGHVFVKVWKIASLYVILDLDSLICRQFGVFEFPSESADDSKLEVPGILLASFLAQYKFLASEWLERPIVSSKEHWF